MKKEEQENREFFIEEFDMNIDAMLPAAIGMASIRLFDYLYNLDKNDILKECHLYLPKIEILEKWNIVLAAVPKGKEINKISK